MTEFRTLERIGFEGIKPDDVFHKKCDGLYYRGSKTCWFNREGMGDTVRLRFLKKRSCTGCGTCEWLSEEFEQTKYMDGGINFPFAGINDVEHGKLYTIHIESWQDYFGEYDYEISIIEVKDENIKQ